MIEVSLSHPNARITPLNGFPKEIVLKPETEFPYEQRHLQLRNDQVLRYALSLRSRIIGACRNVLKDLGFLEIETPLLFKSTSEGAREFIIPTRRRGYAFALPQSPQQFKQLLMASGIEKYFQLAKCFRDEDLRADRQPEFLQVSRYSEVLQRKPANGARAQLDIEQAFSNSEKICDCVEAIVTQAFKGVLDVDLPRQFARMTYLEAMSSYGSDKPDLRLPILPFKKMGHIIPVDLVRMISSLSDPIVEAMVVPLQCSATESRLLLRDFLDSSEGQTFTRNPDGGPGIFIYESSKPLQGLAAFGFEAVENLEGDLDLEDGFVIVLQARKKVQHSGGSTFLGDLRNRLAEAAIRKGFLDEPSWLHFEPVWITDFPLFSPANISEPGQGGHAGFASTHHPFTSPKTSDDVDLLLTEPTKVIGEHYDLVINGEEIGGGSQRVHQAAMQEFIFRKILKMDDAKVQEFSHLLEALRAGCPPHAGIALGMDRLVAMMASSKFKRKLSMRDVIAFPKSGKGDDPMVKSPGLITSSALETYHLRLRE
ncbi:MAG: aspartate--tRNA ligase msd1 [Ramalina farinacea]|uniref:Aspartate--tRNA ligase msd1 n=1 Tax=Ramalina farinacea TaxID=258253 RepID=A0AA43QUD1_9LECA|nr:aspartate--tRNA ligase msd1 [Ramalina farinacea]